MIKQIVKNYHNYKKKTITKNAKNGVKLQKKYSIFSTNTTKTRVTGENRAFLG